MSSVRANAAGLLAYTALVAATTFLITDQMNQREHVAPAAAEVRTAPNDVALQTVPGAKPALPAPTPARGGKVVSTTEVHVGERKPVRIADTFQPAKECATADGFTCPPLDLRLDLIEVDGQQYMAVRGPDDVEVAGRFLPGSPVAAPQQNSAGVELFADGSKAFRYERRVLGRFWAGPAGLISGDGLLTPGVSVRGEW